MFRRQSDPQLFRRHRATDSASRFRRKPLFEALEQRLLLSADIVPAVAAQTLLDPAQSVQDASTPQAPVVATQTIPLLVTSDSSATPTTQPDAASSAADGSGAADGAPSDVLSFSTLLTTPAAAADLLALTGVPDWTSVGPGGLLLDAGDNSPDEPATVPGAGITSSGPSRTAGGQVEGMIGTPVAGAVTAVVVSPSDPNVIYIGTTNGGVWKTTNANATQVVDLNAFPDPLMDGGPNLAGAGTTGAATAGSGLGEGTYRYVVTFVEAGTQVESRASLPLTVSTSAGNQQVTLDNLPLGPTGTAARKIYRTSLADATYQLVDTISDNTTRTYVDSKADGALGASRTKTILFPHWTPLTGVKFKARITSGRFLASRF